MNPTLTALVQRVFSKKARRYRPDLRNVPVNASPTGILEFFSSLVEQLASPFEVIAKLLIVWESAQVIVSMAVPNAFPLLSIVVPLFCITVITAAVFLRTIETDRGEAPPSILLADEPSLESTTPTFLPTKGAMRIRRESDFLSSVLDEMRNAADREEIQNVELPLYNGKLMLPPCGFLATAAEIVTRKQLRINYAFALPGDIGRVTHEQLEEFLALFEPFADAQIAHLTENVTKRFALQMPVGALWLFGQRAVLTHRRDTTSGLYTTGNRTKNFEAIERVRRIQSRYLITAIDGTAFVTKMKAATKKPDLAPPPPLREDAESLLTVAK
jgi:hypothetical protein